MASTPNLAVASSSSSNALSVAHLTEPRDASGSGGTDSLRRNSGGEFIMQLQQENETLRKELDLKESKLQTHMNSIKTFWSPELKQERCMRKEEGARVTALREQLRVAQEENQHSQLTIQAMHDELRTQRDLNQMLQDDFAQRHSRDDSLTSSGGGGSFHLDGRYLQEENDRLSREYDLLQRTTEELEERIEAQRQILQTRDESVRKLLEMLQCKASTNATGADQNVEIDALHIQLTDCESRLSHMELLLREKNHELAKIKSGTHRSASSDVFESNDASNQANMELINVKNATITSLERTVRDLEIELDGVKRLKDEEKAERDDDVKQLDAYKKHSAQTKNKIDQLKSDLQKKETEMLTLQTRLDTLNNHQSDSRQHIDVLKESLNAKEQRNAILQAEVDSIRERLNEKQEVLNQKQEQLTRIQEERSTSSCQLQRLKETLDVKDRKVAVLHKKIESLAEALHDKERQLNEHVARLASLQEDSSTSDSALSTMEEALTEKEKMIELLREEKSKLVDSHDKLADQLSALHISTEKRNGAMQRDLEVKENSLTELRERASAHASSVMKKDTRIAQLEIAIQQSENERENLETQLRTLEESNELEKLRDENDQKISEMEERLKAKETEIARSQGEIDRILEILTQAEDDKHKKDVTIHTLEKQNREKIAELKTLSSQMLEEVRRKGMAQDNDAQRFLSQLKHKDDRIDELEEALRESVRITADREQLLSREETNRRKVERQAEEVNTKLATSSALVNELQEKVHRFEAELDEKENHLKLMKQQRKKQMEEALVVKQEALLSAISEKDANIALLELSQSRKKANADEVAKLKRDKERLMYQLKLQNMKIHDEDDSLQKQLNSVKPNQSASTKHRQTDGEGIWA